jgi:site-specific DNA-adenine methylase
MSEDLLRRLFDTKHSLPVITPQTIQLLQSIVGFQQPDNEYRSLALQASRFADLQQPSRGNLFITDSAKTATQRMLPDEGESGFSLSDLSPDQRQLILERARQGAVDFDDFLTRRNPQLLYTDITRDDKAEQVFRQMLLKPQPVAQFVRKNQQAKTPESSDADRNASSVQAAKRSSQSSQGDKVQKALSRAAAAVTSKKQSAARPNTKSTTQNAVTSQNEYKPSPAEEQLRGYFEKYKAAGNIPEANKYAIELHNKYGWLFGSVRAKDPNGGFFGTEWPYIKPPGSQGVENLPLQGTEAYINRNIANNEAAARRQRIRQKQEAEQRERLTNRSTFSKMLDPALPVPTTEIIPALTDIAEGAAMGFTSWAGDRVAGLGRLIEEAENMGRQVANGVRRNFINDPNASPPQPTISSRRAATGESIRESGEKAANASREYLADFGQSIPSQVGAAGGEIIPDLLLSTATGNPALTFGISSATSSYGQGKPLSEAILTGIVNARGVEGGNVLAARLEQLVTGKFGKYLVRSAVQGTQNIGTTAALQGDIPDTPQKAAKEILFALGFGIFPAGHPKAKVAEDTVLAIANTPQTHPAIRAEIIKVLKEYRASRKAPIEVPAQFDEPTVVPPSPAQTLPDSTVDPHKTNHRNWAREAVADKRSKDQARREQWAKESESSTQSQDDSQSKTGGSDTPVNSNKSLTQESTNPEKDTRVLVAKEPSTVAAPLLEIQPAVEAAKNPEESKESTNTTPGTPESVRQKVVAEPEVALPKAVLEPESASPRTVAETEIKSPKTVTEPEITLPVETALQAKPIESASAKAIGETLSFKILKLVRSPLSGYVGNKKSMLWKGAYDGIIPVEAITSRWFSKINDVFGGSGLLSNAIQAQLKIPRLLNDFDEDIVNFHKVAKENSSELKDILRGEESLISDIVERFPEGGVEAHDAVQKYWNAMKARLASGNEIAKAALTTIINNGSLAIMGRGQRIIQGKDAKNKYGWLFSKKTFQNIEKQLDQHGQLLVDTEVVNLDARKVLENAKPGELTLVDPPYVQHADRNTPIADYKKGKDLVTLEGALDFINTDIAAAAQRGVPIIYTNNAHPDIMQALKNLGFKTKTIDVDSQNNGGKHGTREEVIAWNDPVRQGPTGGRGDSAKRGIRESEPGRLDDMDERAGSRQIPSTDAAPEGIPGSDGLRPGGIRGRGRGRVDPPSPEENDSKKNSATTQKQVKAEPGTSKKNLHDEQPDGDLDIEDWGSLSKLAARHIEEGTGKFADFSKRMTKALGDNADRVKPHFRQLFNEYHYSKKKRAAQSDNQTLAATRIPEDEATVREGRRAELMADRQFLDDLINGAYRQYQSRIKDFKNHPWIEIEKEISWLGNNFLTNRRRLNEISQILSDKKRTQQRTPKEIEELSRNRLLFKRKQQQVQQQFNQVFPSLLQNVKAKRKG